MAIITGKDLSFAYDGKTVLEGVNFTLSAGDYLCVVGENGSGKSTLVKGLLGLKAPDSGSIVFGEELRPAEIGYLPQQTIVQKDFPASVYEVVLSGCQNSLE
jgi:zinc transport system ATP-binding protein